MDVDNNRPGPSRQNIQTQDIIVDPDTREEIPDPKRPRLQLDSSKKEKCLKILVEAYIEILKAIMNVTDDTREKMSEYVANVTLGSQITSIIFTLHNVSRQRVRMATSNMISKASVTSFNVRYMNGDYSMDRDRALNIWNAIVTRNGLKYEDYRNNQDDDWYGTMGPYLDMFSCFSLRLSELRLGHHKMPISKRDGGHIAFPVAKYGLSGAHHILLEGVSYPPEKRSSIVQSLGPMTVFLCMIRTEGIYRNKYSAAVKRAMAHIPAIDDIIEITKTHKMAHEISIITALIAEILLITTSRQATRMCFPLNMFALVYNALKGSEEKKDFLEFFNTTGSGGWLLYKMACQFQWTIAGEIPTEKAAQIVYHGIFGTYKEDLGVLGQITETRNWFTREELGTCFRGMTSQKKTTPFKLPKQTLYSKMSCANQSGLLTGIYTQVSTLPCFSGPRVQNYTNDFFNHIEKRNFIASGGKNINQIVQTLSSTLDFLHDRLRSKDGKLEMGTAVWRSMETLGLNNVGEEVQTIIVGNGKMFLGANNHLK